MADSSKDIQLRELKDMINDLKKMIKTLQATVDAANKREAVLTQERDNLKEEIDLLRKKLFGTSSEKRTLDIPGQLNFFNEAELEQDPEFGSVEISGGIQASDLVQSSLKCLILLRGHIINRVDVRKIVPGKSVGNKFVDGIGTGDILVNVCLQSAGTVAFLQ